MNSTGEEEQRLLLAAALQQSGYTVGELWLRFFAIGGSVGEYEVEAYLSGLILLPTLQRDLLAHAANELIDELPQRPRAPYSDNRANGIEPDDDDSRVQSGDGRDLGRSGPADRREDSRKVDAQGQESPENVQEQGNPDRS